MKITPVKQWRRQKDTALLLGKQGEILQWTLIRVPSAHFMDQAPYPVIIVSMQDGSRMIGQLVDWAQEDLVAGKKVEAVLRRAYQQDAEGIILYTVKFKPI
jgi:uncharacterized OB-fold protein